MDIQTTYDERAKLWDQMKALHTEMGDDASAEQQTKWDKLDTRVTQLTKVIERANKLNDVPDHTAGNTVSMKEVGKWITRKDEREMTTNERFCNTELLIEACIRHRGSGELEQRHYDCLNALGWSENDASTRDIDIRMSNPALERRDLNVATDTATLPTGFQTELAAELNFEGNARQFCRVVQTNNMSALEWPIVSDSANDAALLAEATTFDSGTYLIDPAFLKVTFNAYKYVSGVRASYEWVSDSFTGMGGEIGRMLGARLARIQNSEYVVGDGVGNPNGFITAADANTDAEVTYVGAIDQTVLFDCYHKLEPGHRGRAVWVMRDATISAIRQLAESTGQLLWQPGLQLGQPDQLLGKRVIPNEKTAADAINEEGVVCFGNFSQHIIRDAGPTRLRILNERFAETDEIAYVILGRHDSDTLTDATWTNPPVIIANRGGS